MNLSYKELFQIIHDRFNRRNHVGSWITQISWQAVHDIVRAEAALAELRVDSFCEYSTAIPAPICPAALAQQPLTDADIIAEARKRYPQHDDGDFYLGGVSMAKWARDRMAQQAQLSSPPDDGTKVDAYEAIARTQPEMPTRVDALRLSVEYVPKFRTMNGDTDPVTEARIQTAFYDGVLARFAPNKTT